MAEDNAGGRYQFVEPQGGCIIPRRCDPKRSMAIRTFAASWHGAKFTPNDPAAWTDITSYVIRPPAPDTLAKLLASAQRPRRATATEGD